jgi:predicted transposase/invertase (TIGR01784 family)
MKFVDVKNDVAFRKIFGNDNRKETLISFLNAVLDFQGDQRVTMVTIVNPYQLPSLKGGKVTIIDVKATDQKGNSFIVEMQVADEKDFDKRVLYYASKSYTNQIRRSDQYKKLKPVYFIGILDFDTTQNPHFISRSRIVDIETGEQTIKGVEFNYVELRKFNKKLSELTTLTEKWVYFIKNAENLDVLPDDLDDAGLRSAYEEANVQTWSQKELDAYDYAFMREAQERSRLEMALEKGEKRGEERGEERGIQKNRNEMVVKMHTKGISANQISDLTDITLDTVKEIIEKHAS